jgi:hypothetical protein
MYSDTTFHVQILKSLALFRLPGCHRCVSRAVYSLGFIAKRFLRGEDANLTPNPPPFSGLGTS